jgi:hypothetical protein
LVSIFRQPKNRFHLTILPEHDLDCAGLNLKSYYALIIYFSRDEQLTSYSEFKVHKQRRRSPEPDQKPPVRRLMCLSETCIIERDPATYAVVCARSLKDVSCNRMLTI